MREGLSDQELDYLAIKDGGFPKIEYIPTNENFFVFGPGHQSKVALVLPDLINMYLVTLANKEAAARLPMASMVEAVESAELREKTLNTLIDFMTQELNQFIPGNDLYLIIRGKQSNLAKAQERFEDFKQQLKFQKVQIEAVNNFLDRVLTDEQVADSKLLQKLYLVLDRVEKLSASLTNVADITGITDELITEIKNIESDYEEKRFSS